MRTNKAGLGLIKSFEGCKLKAYKCPAGVWTIGYGNTFYEDGRKVKQGDTINQEMADDLLINLLPKYEAIVKNKIKVPLSDNQFAALVSHTYNTGGSKTLFELVNRHTGDVSIRTWFETKYTHAAGVELAGLVRRRKAEADLYFKK